MTKYQESEEPTLITQKEAANLLRMSEAWLERKRYEGAEPAYLKIGGRVFYEKEDLLRWIKLQKQNG